MQEAGNAANGSSKCDIVEKKHLKVKVEVCIGVKAKYNK
jgi:hypothetical protein